MEFASLQFLLNGEPVEVVGVSPQTTLLEWLRETRGLTGTKEGCAEGDCGACTVVLAEPAGDGLAWKPINACIRLLPSLDGKAIFTVESLKAATGLHPVQQALVECHGSQCGFCTPGFAMSLFGLYKNAHRPDREAVDDALSGNLCRCTGYRPILAAAQRMYDLDAAHGWRAPGVAADGSRIVSREEESLIGAIGLDHPRRYARLRGGWPERLCSAGRRRTRRAARCAPRCAPRGRGHGRRTLDHQAASAAGHADLHVVGSGAHAGARRRTRTSRSVLR